MKRLGSYSTVLVVGVAFVAAGCGSSSKSKTTANAPGTPSTPSTPGASTTSASTTGAPKIANLNQVVTNALHQRVPSAPPPKNMSCPATAAVVGTKFRCTFIDPTRGKKYGLTGTVTAVKNPTSTSGVSIDVRVDQKPLS